MTKKRNFRQITATSLLFAAGILLGLALGLLLIPKEQQLTIRQVLPESVGKVPAENLVIPPVLGNTRAKISITEYGDYECDFCARYYNEVFTGLMREYINSNQINYTYKDYLLTTHDNNVQAAMTAYCAGEQNLYWEMHNLLFTRFNDWAGKTDANSVFEEMINETGIDYTLYKSCFESEKYLSLIHNNIEEGRKLDIKVTPTIFVNEIKIEGLQSAEYYKKVIDGEIAKLIEITE